MKRAEARALGEAQSNSSVHLREFGDRVLTQQHWDDTGEDQQAGDLSLLGGDVARLHFHDDHLFIGCGRHA